MTLLYRDNKPTGIKITTENKEMQNTVYRKQMKTERNKEKPQVTW